MVELAKQVQTVCIHIKILVIRTSEVRTGKVPFMIWTKYYDDVEEDCCYSRSRYVGGVIWHAWSFMIMRM